MTHKLPDGRKVSIKKFKSVPDQVRKPKGKSPAGGITEVLSKMSKGDVAIIPPRGDEGDMPVRVYNGTVRQYCRTYGVKFILRSLPGGRVGVYRVA